MEMNFIPANARMKSWTTLAKTMARMAAKKPRWRYMVSATPAMRSMRDVTSASTLHFMASCSWKSPVKICCSEMEKNMTVMRPTACLTAIG